MTSPRPLRADARRNRAALLEAAQQVFATKGVTAATEEVARAAGVGIGTLFRHFPTKEALLEAVYRARLRAIADEARGLAGADDPGAALLDFFRDTVVNSGPKLAVTDALAAAGFELKPAEVPEARALGDALRVLLVRAQQAGAVRADLGLRELIALLVGASSAVRFAENDAIRVRTIEVIVDGLRTPRRTRRPSTVEGSPKPRS
jgi:AcrR family transcriptional regulator